MPTVLRPVNKKLVSNDTHGMSWEVTRNFSNLQTNTTDNRYSLTAGVCKDLSLTNDGFNTFWSPVPRSDMLAVVSGSPNVIDLRALPFWSRISTRFTINKFSGSNTTQFNFRIKLYPDINDLDTYFLLSEGAKSLPNTSLDSAANITFMHWGIQGFSVCVESTQACVVDFRGLLVSATVPQYENDGTLGSASP